MRTGFFAFTLLVLSSGSALAAPFDNITTHNAAVPEQSFQLAATWFLPDWQASSSSRTETAPSGSGDIPIECKNYSPSCSTPKILGGKKVRIGNIFCSIECVCPSSYATTECDPEYTLSGSPCTYNGITYYQGCNPRPCSDKGADYFATKQTNLKCSEVTYGGRTCYQCVDPCSGLTDHKEDENCKAFGCKEEYGDGCSYCKTCYTDGCHNYPNAIAVKDTTYGCEEAYDDCSSKCKTPYEDNCHNNTTKTLASSCTNGCAKGETVDGCDSRCKNGCKADCKDGTHLSTDETSCVNDVCPDGYDTTVTKCGDGYDLKPNGQSGDLPCNKCVAKTACTEGSTSCNKDTENATANGYYVGDSPCYTCTAKTCAQMGKKDCNGSCIASSECCGGCAAGQACQNGSCVSTETCRKQAEAKGYKVIETAADLDSYADTAGNKLVVNGTVTHSSNVNLNTVTVDDAKTTVGGMCTQTGSLKLNNAYPTGSLTMNVSLEAKNLYLNKNIKKPIILAGPVTSIDTIEITSGTAAIGFNGGTAYATNIKVSGNAARPVIVGGTQDIFTSGKVLPMSQRYPVQFDNIELTDGAALTLGNGMGVGAINITGTNTKLPTILNIGSASRIILHPMKPSNEHSPFTIWDCQNAGCVINFGEPGYNGGTAKFNFNYYGIDFLPGSSSNYYGSYSPRITVNNFNLGYFGEINTNNLSRPVNITFSSIQSQLSLINFYGGNQLGANPSSGGMTTCTVSATSLSQYSGCNNRDNTCTGSCWEER